MIYKKKYEIEGKIISKIDIINMVNNILEKYSTQKELLVEIEAQFNDGTSIINKDVSIFNHIYFEKLLLEKINVYIRYDYNDRINITIYNSDSYNRAEIETYDKSLYDSFCHSIEESLSLMRNQKKFYLLSNKWWGDLLIFILSLLLEILLIFCIESIFKLKLPSVIIYLMVLLLPTIITSYTIHYIEKNYPTNQFYFGESSVNKPKSENGYVYKFIMFIITNVVIPIIISLITG